MSTIQVKDATGTVQTIQTQPAPGQTTSGNSVPVVIASDQSTVNVDVTNFPATQTVAGTVSVSNFPATQPVSGSVSVGNTVYTPANVQPCLAGAAVSNSNPIPVSITTSSTAQTITGSVSVSNLPATQPVSGTVSVTNSTSSPINVVQVVGSSVVSNANPSPAYVTNFPASQAVTNTGTFAVQNTSALPAGSNAIGSVSVSNFPSSQAVTVAALPLPSGGATSALQSSTQAAAGSSSSVATGIQGVSGGVAVAVSLATAPTTTIIQPTASSLNAAVVGNVASGAADSGNGVKVSGIYNSTAPTFSSGQRGDIQLDTNGNIKTTLTVGTAILSSATNTADANAASVGLTVTPYNRIYNGSTWDRMYSVNGVTSAGTGVLATGLVPVTSGVAELKHKLFAAATTNATSVKTTAGRLIGGFVSNKNTSTDYFLKLYNMSTAPTVGTSVPVITIPLLFRQSVYIAEIVSAYGSYFSTGIAYAITASYLDSDTTAVTTAGDVTVNLLYV